MPERFLKSIRLLAECYQAFEQTSGRHVRQLGLTPAQFDIVATLGRTHGMTFKQLGEMTLITKGTLTGVVDRLADRGLVARVPSASDGRSTVVRLTAAGDRLFDQVFPAHIGYLKTRFKGFAACDLDALERQLTVLREALVSGDRAKAGGDPAKAGGHPAPAATAFRVRRPSS